MKIKINRVDYEYNGDDDEYIYLTVHVFKHMDSSLINVDVQTNYVRVTLKGKSLQLALSEEVMPDSSTAQRSQTTGYLVLKMPKVNKVIRPTPPQLPLQSKKENKTKEASSNYLEIDDTKKRIDLANICTEANRQEKQKYLNKQIKLIKERENSPDFIDNSDVPPLC